MKFVRSIVLFLSVGVLIVSLSSALHAADKVDATTLDGKLMAGYQAWFRTPGDGSINGDKNKWIHWGKPPYFSVEFWPEMAEYKNKLDTGIKLANGEPAYVYSGWDPSAIDLHFKWMKDYNIDGVYLQTFIGRIRREKKAGQRDHHILRNVIESAEKHGRVFALEYDISTRKSGGVIDDVLEDWENVVNEGYTKSSAWLHHDGKPVLAIWGFGFTDDTREYSPADAKELISRMKNHPNPKCRPYLIGGVPTAWRTLERDSRTEEEWAEVYAMFDVISPWTVGRYQTLEEVDRHYERFWERDLEYLKDKDQRYLPVIYPGSSMCNLKRERGEPNHNSSSREGGHFLWRQARALIEGGARSIKIAMFDEVDEGTAIYKVTTSYDEVPDISNYDPEDFPPGLYLTTASDGYDLPSDHYLKLAGEINRALDNPDKLTNELPIDAPLKKTVTSRPHAWIAMDPTDPDRYPDGAYQRAWVNEKHVWQLTGSEDSEAFYVRVGESFADAVEEELEVSVDFFADKQGMMKLEYRRKGAREPEVLEVEVPAVDNGWHQASFVLDNVDLRKPFEGRSNFKLYRENKDGEKTPMSIASITLTRD